MKREREGERGREGRCDYLQTVLVFDIRQSCMTLAVIRKSILSSICSSESCTLHTI